MPGPIITPNANLSQLRSYVEQVTNEPRGNIKITYNNPIKLGSHDQRSLQQSIGRSANGRPGEALALSMLHQALANSYGDAVADQVFDRMSTPLFNGKATLTTGLIDQARQVAKQIRSGQPKPSLKTDIEQPPRSNMNNVERANDVASKRKPKKNSARGRADSSPLADKRAKLADLRDKTVKVKQIYDDLGNLMRANAKKRAANKAKLLQKRQMYKSKLRKPKRQHSADNIAKRRELVMKNKGMQATRYLDIMKKGGNKHGVMSFGDLLKASTYETLPKLNEGDRANARNAIRNAFLAYDTDTLATMTDMDKTHDIVVPALRAFLIELRKQES